MLVVVPELGQRVLECARVVTLGLPVRRVLRLEIGLSGVPRAVPLHEVFHVALLVGLVALLHGDHFFVRFLGVLRLVRKVKLRPVLAHSFAGGMVLHKRDLTRLLEVQDAVLHRSVLPRALDADLALACLLLVVRLGRIYVHQLLALLVNALENGEVLYGLHHVVTLKGQLIGVLAVAGALIRASTTVRSLDLLHGPLQSVRQLTADLGAQVLIAEFSAADAAACVTEIAIIETQ